LGTDRPLAKVFTKNGSRSYPLAKNFTSYAKSYTDLAGLEGALKEHSIKGHCLLKGHPDEKLNNERRRGKVNRDQRTNLLVIDLDDIESPFEIPERVDKEFVARLAERLVKYLPEEFQDVSFIAQASSSLGLGGSKVSTHLFFMLEEEVHPATLQAYLTQINLDSEWFANQLTLSASGDALHYPVDRTITEPSRLIYIASPIFGDGVTNPFYDNNDRFVRIEKDKERLSLDLSDISIGSTDRRVRRRITELRRAAGLGDRRTKIQSVTMSDGHSVNVVMNPDKIVITRYNDEGQFVRYDVNDGDSHAYWCWKYSPEVMHCFKGEPAFWFEAADPVAYRDHLRDFPVEDAEDDIEKRILFTDRATSGYYFARYRSKEGRLEELTPIKRDTIKVFARDFDVVLPDDMPPVWDLQFQPQRSQVIDVPNKFINRYQMPEMIRNPRGIPQEFKGIEFGYAQDAIKRLCPTIHALIDSVVGNGEEEYEHFVNWLAFIVNERQKTGVAWVMHGTQGTGKGVLFHHVLAPILGEAHARMMLLDQVMDQFNGWLEENLILAVDEFSMQGLGARELSIVNKLKNLITEHRGSIRRMHCQSVETRLYSNILIFSNNLDAVKLQAGDRRFNIAPPQDTALRISNTGLFQEDGLIPLVKQETGKFAAFMLEFRYNAAAAQTPLENAAKQEMREHARDTIDDFVSIAQMGMLDELIHILDMSPPFTGEDYVTPAKMTLKSILREYDPDKPQEWKHSVHDMMCLYAAGSKARGTNVAIFGKMLSHRGLPSKAIRFNKVVKRGYHVAWSLTANDIETLRTRYMTADEMKIVTNIPPQEVL
jgi:hypothetical protein